jgi:hypothetical protein
MLVAILAAGKQLRGKVLGFRLIPAHRNGPSEARHVDAAIVEPHEPFRRCANEPGVSGADGKASRIRVERTQQTER